MPDLRPSRAALVFAVLGVLALVLVIAVGWGKPGPAEASTLTNATSVTAGTWHTCARITTGGVLCWGANLNGQIGDGTNTERSSPRHVLAGPGAGPLLGVTAVGAGNHFNCALMGGGNVKCWGRNLDGQLGDGTKTNRLTPVDVLASPGGAPLGGVAALAPGDQHACVLTTTGTVKCWGNNGSGRLGDGTTVERLTPVDVLQSPGGPPLSGIAAVASGGAHSCALTQAGTVLCWGSNGNGRLGIGTAVAASTTPVFVCATGATAPCTPGNGNILTGVQSLSVGNRHTCVVTSTGTMKCWGFGGSGRLGDGTMETRNTPADVCATGATPPCTPGNNNILTGMTSSDGGTAHTCARTSTGVVKCWGSNSFGQLGDKTETDRLRPVDVCGNTPCNTPLGGIASVATGAFHSCGLTTAGGIKCWGHNDGGQLGDGTSCGNFYCTLPTDVNAPPPPPTAAPTPPPTPTPAPYSCSVVTQIPEVQCEALVALFESTDGPNSWLNKSGWLVSLTPCSWQGVSCAGGNVTRVELPSNGMTGTLPPEIGDLTSLLWLDLKFNLLNGAIPAGIGNLVNLTSLDLGNNEFTGTLPSGLANLSNLIALDLSNNELGGNILPVLGGLSNLVSMALAGNNLSGNIPPELGNLGNLWILSLSHNNLSGSIPSALGSAGQLRLLALDHNSLSGSIPSALGNLSELRELRLSHNNLTGSIPSALAGPASLEELQLAGNGLSGAIPPSLGGLGQLERLDLQSNQLTGGVPAELGNLAALKELYLNSNPLTGALPTALTGLNLTAFWFHDTVLCEPLDAAFQDWLATIGDLQSSSLLCSDPSPCDPPPPWPVPEGDSDCDGFSDEREIFMGTDPFVACGTNAWPPDLNDDGVVNITDMLIVANRFLTAPPDPNYGQRYDMNADFVINITDLLIIAGFFLKTCN